MRSKLFLILGLVLTLALTGNAQTKTSGTVSCAKPDPAYSIDVGDRNGHSVSISKSACTWTKSMDIAELQSKDGYDVTVIFWCILQLAENGSRRRNTAENGSFECVLLRPNAANLGPICAELIFSAAGADARN